MLKPAAIARKWIQGVATASCLATLLASTAPALADNTDPQRVEERLPATPKQPADAAGPATLTPAPAPQTALANFPEFNLHAVTIEGMTAIDPSRANACTQTLIDKIVGGADLAKLAQCITQIYRDEGFFLSRAFIPPQEVQGGILEVRVIEGYIAAVSPAGMGEADADSQFAAPLRERPATLQTFERALLLLADRYGYRVTASQLVAEPQDPARYTFNVKVTRAPLSWRIFADNRGTDAHGPDQLYGWLGWNSVVTDSDRVAGTLFTSPSSTRELLYGDINYAAAWCAGAFSTEFGASFSKAEDGSIPRAIALRSEAERYYARLTVPVLRSRAQSLWLGLLLDARETAERQPSTPGADESTRLLRGSLAYALVDSVSRTDVALEVSQGIDALDASRNGDPQLTRADGRPQFTKLRLDASRIDKLSGHWELQLSAAAQLADGALVGGEEFGAGGARFGRAYDYSEITGDDGAAAAIELRYTIQNAFGALANLQLYAFADAAWIWNRQSDPTGIRDADLSSAGLGARLTPFAGITASVELAKPLSRDVAEEGDRDLRVFLSLSAGW